MTLDEITRPTQPLKKWVVAWGEKRNNPIGKVEVEARDEKEARRIFKRDYIDARAFGWGVIQISYVFEKNAE